MMMDRPKHILLVIVASQLMGTSLWFSGNAILGPLTAKFPNKVALPIVCFYILGFHIIISFGEFIHG